VTTTPPPAAPPPPVPATVAPVARTTTSGLAVASLVLGIVSFFCLGFLVVIPILAIVFGHVALGRIAGSGGSVTGRGLAIAGAVLGWIFLVPVVLATFAWLGYGISNS
jgi:uncharacterized protein DUF4190